MAWCSSASPMGDRWEVAEHQRAARPLAPDRPAVDRSSQSYASLQRRWHATHGPMRTCCDRADASVRGMASSPRQVNEPEDPRASARAAGLRYSTDARPGISRRRAGRGFTYRTADGDTIRDGDVLRRIKAVAIPPAWTDVWICPDPRGHLQATGRDARGRKQYRYHPRWREVRDEVKYGRLIAFAQALPRIRARAEADLRKSGLPRETGL